MEDYIFKQYSTLNGFPTSIQTLYAESKGCLWIGTQQGLGCFNGYSLKFYTHQTNKVNSIPGNIIHQILEDPFHQIWVLTNQGIALYHNESDSFFTLTKNQKGERIRTAAACLMENKILCSSNGYLYLINTQTREIAKEIKLSQPDFFAHEIWIWDKQTILCVNKWQGAFLIDINTGNFLPSPFDNAKDIAHILIDNQQQIWTTSYNKGITCYHKNGKILHHYTTSNSKLSHDVILCLSEHQGEIWAGTDGGGINIINPSTKQIKVLYHISGDKNSLPVNTIQCLFQHPDTGEFWAGSVKGGAISIRKSFIKTYEDVPLTIPNGLSEKAILSFYQEPNTKEIWIGTDGGGINRFNPENKKFRHYPPTSNKREKIVALCGYNDKELLVSIFSKGLFVFNKQSGEFTSINHKIPEISHLAMYGRKAINLYQDNAHSALILGKQIYRYNFQSGELSLISGNIKIGSQTIGFSSDSINSYLHDSQHVYAVNHSTNTTSILFTSHQKQPIISATKDSIGRIWIGYKHQLSCYNPKTKKEQNITSLRNEQIGAIAYDKNNRIWIGSNNQLYAWIINQNKLIAWDESDGVTPNEFLNKAILTSQEGDIYMGGVNGMLYIDTKNFQATKTENTQFTLSNIVSGNQSLLKSIHINKGEKKLILTNKDKPIGIQVMAHENNLSRKKHFRWHIGKLHEQIIDSNIPEITLRSLPIGTYPIAVSCTAADGEWTTPCHLITLIVPPAWYQSWWFILLVTMILFLILILAIIYILKRKEARVEMAIKEHKQKIYEEKVRFLININHELRTPLTLIHTPLNMLIKQTNTDNPLYPTLQNMLKQSHRMKNLLNMVLNLRKMEMVTNTLNIQPYALNKWIQEVGSDFVFAGEEKGIHISYQLDERIEEVEFDKESHLIILTNLITNAFKHSPLNGTILISTQKDDSHHSVHIAVKDQGNGLQEEDINHLFTRFYQGKDEKEGSGIGLSYAKILVEQHHGHIGAANNEGKGACFFYELPIKQKETGLTDEGKDYLNNCLFPECENEDKTYIPIACDVDTRNYSCLFVDDSEDLRNLAVETLKDQFQNLYVAADGKEGLQIAMSEIPDIIISDIMMPHVNGYELCRKIKENMNINHIQVILLTARIDEQSHLDGYRIGADAYLEKPFETSMLLETVRNRLFLRETIRKRYLHTPVSLIHEKPLQSADDTFLFKLNRLIIDHMSDNELNIMFLCQEMGMSRASLYNKLKPLTDMSPNEYINKIRMESAMEMLRQSDLNITEIAEKTGFSSSRYFSTAFKKFTGITPSQYKEQQK